MTTTDTSQATRIITLSFRSPVRIRVDEWPQIAIGDERPGAIVNGTPVPEYETDHHTLRVRQHADGRALVYGVTEGAARTGTRDWRGGEVLSKGDDIVAAIRRVGYAGHMPDSVISACVADLPPEDL